MRIYTKNGDRGATRLRGGIKVSKDHDIVWALGDLDEVQAALGMARSECGLFPDVNAQLLAIERDLWQLMAVVADWDIERGNNSEVTDFSAYNSASDQNENDQTTLELSTKVVLLERYIDEMTDKLDLARGFVLPGESKVSAYLDFARTVVRRAERQIVRIGMGASEVQKYLNRLSDFCWALARSLEPNHVLSAIEDNEPG